MDTAWRTEAARSIRDRLIRDGAAQSRMVSIRLLSERRQLTRLSFFLACASAGAAVWSFLAIVMGLKASADALVGAGFFALAAAGGASTVWALRNGRDPAAVEEAAHRARRLEAAGVRNCAAGAPGAPAAAARTPLTMEDAIRAACAEL
jgi:hypothetical protein